jgi:hypothetical protein
VLAWFFLTFPEKNNMKKLHLILAFAISASLVTACANNAGSDTNKTDSSANVTPPPDNSSATNPSLADTNYSKNQDSSGMKKDSSKIKQ